MTELFKQIISCRTEALAAQKTILDSFDSKSGGYPPPPNQGQAVSGGINQYPQQQTQPPPNLNYPPTQPPPNPNYLPAQPPPNPNYPPTQPRLNPKRDLNPKKEDNLITK